MRSPTRALVPAAVAAAFVSAVACRFDRSKLTPCLDTSQCDATLRCDRDAGLCLERLDAGEGCAASTDCLSAACIDSVCCATPCSGACRACNLSGTRGLCAYIPLGQDPSGECVGQANCGGSCNGNGACAYPDGGTVCGATCAGGIHVESRCSSSVCAAQNGAPCGLFSCNAGGSACNTGCAGHSDCNVDAGFCEDAGCAPKKGGGSSCGGAVECVSGSCVQSVCGG